MEQYFKVEGRNPGHWDIVAEGKGRVFKIRGSPGKFTAFDERERPCPVTEFKTLSTCMQFICDELMYETI
jgi:hypothetical protein